MKRLRDSRLVGVLSLVGVTALIVGATVAIGSAASEPQHTKIHVVAAPQFSFVDNNDPGDSPGDVLIFAGPMLDLTGHQVGRVDGYCVYTQVNSGVATFEECQASHSFDAGQITVQDTFELDKEGSQKFAVNGGTDAYRNVRGEMTITPLENGQFDLLFNLIG